MWNKILGGIVFITFFMSSFAAWHANRLAKWSDMVSASLQCHEDQLSGFDSQASCEIARNLVYAYCQEYPEQCQKREL